MNNLRIVFMGTPEFAVASLAILLKNNYNVVGVITVPDKPAGRGQQLQQSAIKKYALKKELTILQPEKLKNELFLSQLAALNANLQIVVAFRMLPEVVWNMPNLGTVNLHGSLLPQYRGAAPINHAIINGEIETGVSTFFLQQEIDTGKIIFREKTTIADDETAGELHDKLMDIGATLVLKTVQVIEMGNYPQLNQADLLPANSTLKSAPKIFKEDCKINWSLSLIDIHNQIRGLSPYPTAFTNLVGPNGNVYILKVFNASTEKVNHSHINKSIITDSKNYIKIAVKSGFIVINELQLAGKKRMNTKDFLRGFALNDEWQLN